MKEKSRRNVTTPYCFFCVALSASVSSVVKNKLSQLFTKRLRHAALLEVENKWFKKWWANPRALCVTLSASVYFVVEFMSSSGFMPRKKLIPNARLTPAKRLARAVQTRVVFVHKWFFSPQRSEGEEQEKWLTNPHCFLCVSVPSAVQLMSSSGFMPRKN